MEAEKPFCRVETQHKYRLYVPITCPLRDIASDLRYKWPLTSAEMYHVMMVFDESITRESGYGKQLNEEARVNLSDKAYAESKEGQWERAVLCVGKTGKVSCDGEDRLVPVQLKRLQRGPPDLGEFVEVHLKRCDYSYNLHTEMTVEAIIDTFERLEI